jgi:hypothetical protein
MTRLNALQGGSGTLLDIDLRIKPDALPGVTADRSAIRAC